MAEESIFGSSTKFERQLLDSAFMTDTSVPDDGRKKFITKVQQRNHNYSVQRVNVNSNLSLAKRNDHVSRNRPAVKTTLDMHPQQFKSYMHIKEQDTNRTVNFGANDMSARGPEPVPLTMPKLNM